MVRGITDSLVTGKLNKVKWDGRQKITSKVYVHCPGVRIFNILLTVCQVCYVRYWINRLNIFSIYIL